jgi:phosphate-selective porin OprO and OprP
MSSMSIDRRSLALLAALPPLVGFGASQSSAQEVDTSRQSIEARLDSLEQPMKVLSRLSELDQENLARGSNPCRDEQRFGLFRSADGFWCLRATGYLQADSRFYLRNGVNAADNNMLIRRARPTFEGTVGKHVDFKIMPDFGQSSSTIYEAYLEARLSPGFGVRAGKFKPPIGLERLQSATDLRFVERGFPTNLAPNRDIGIQVSGELARGVVQYAGGVFDGVVDLGFGDFEGRDFKDFAARLFVIPFATRDRTTPLDVGFGLAVGAGNERGTLTKPVTSTLRSPGQRSFFKYRSNGNVTGTVISDGLRTRIAPQAYLYRGPFGLLGEYTVSQHTITLDSIVRKSPHRAWQVAGSVMLTGERLSFGALTPKRPFDPSKGQWGAFELAARYQGTGVDADLFPTFADPATAARRARAASIGLNWHLARKVKLMADFERTTFTGGAPKGGNRAAEKFFVTRLQTGF